MNQSLVTYEDLQSMFHTKTVAQLRIVLGQNKIKILKDRKGRPTTTVDALNHAMGVPVGGVSGKVDEEQETFRAL